MQVSNVQVGNNFVAQYLISVANPTTVMVANSNFDSITSNFTGYVFYYASVNMSSVTFDSVVYSNSVSIPFNYGFSLDQNLISCNYSNIKFYNITCYPVLTLLTPNSNIDNILFDG